MSEEMNNELEYQEVQRLDLDGKVFALLVEVTEDEEGGDAIIARVDQEDGEDVYVAPTDEEFDAANAKFDELLDE